MEEVEEELQEQEALLERVVWAILPLQLGCITTMEAGDVEHLPLNQLHTADLVPIMEPGVQDLCLEEMPEAEPDLEVVAHTAVRREAMGVVDLLEF